MTKPEKVSYQEIASEYYNALRHPTCANFREASARIISRWLEKLETDEMQICEVGAGNSLLAELLKASNKNYKKLFITDASPAMLSYSGQWASEKNILQLSDATDLSLPAESLDLLVASLGDPYNTPEFWEEVYRVLRMGGIAIFTTPSYKWAVSFRVKFNEEVSSADFELADGRKVSVPSYIYSPENQIELVEKNRLSVLDYTGAPLSEISSEIISPKLLIDNLDENKDSIVEGYLVTKKPAARTNFSFIQYK